MSAWYEHWFDSYYYHILYKDRDFAEAKIFIDHLIDVLNPHPDSKILDAGCGRGRHAVYLSKLNYNVTGIDLSKNNINYASQFKNDKLHFFVHDLRKVFKKNYFDYVFCFFTSLGYFDNIDDNIKVIKTVKNALKENGIFVLDFLNSQKIIKSFNQQIDKSSNKQIDGITFNIQKTISDGFIKKLIHFEDNGKKYKFQEKVRLLNLNYFSNAFSKYNFRVEKIFGNYHLEKYEPETSERLIIVARNQ